MAALGPFSIDMYLPSFPAIAENLNTDISKVSLTLTSYFIGISLGQLVYGPIIDRYGRKKPLIIGLILFVVASIGCAISPDIYTLIVLRLFLALGGCVGMVASRAIIRDRFEDQEIARAFSSLILVMGVAPIVAPTIGGYISSEWGWPYIFYGLAVIATALILVLHFYLAESKTPDKTVSLNIVEVSKSYAEVMRNREFLLNGIASGLVMAGLFAYIAGSPFVLMELYGLSEKSYGWIFGLNAASFIAGSQLNRFLLTKASNEKVTYFAAFAMLLVSLFALVVMSLGDLSLFVLQITLFLFMLISGILSPNTSAMALMPFIKNAGVASALIGSIRMVSGVIASMAISFFHNGTYLPMMLFLVACSVLVYVILYRKRKWDLSNNSLHTELKPVIKS